jgi:hypothetical protein
MTERWDHSMEAQITSQMHELIACMCVVNFKQEGDHQLAQSSDHHTERQAIEDALGSLKGSEEERAGLSGLGKEMITQRYGIEACGLC